MSLASANVKAAYLQVHGVRTDPPLSKQAERELRRKAYRELRKASIQKQREALATVPPKRKSGDAIEKADADLKQQKVEMGDDQQADERKVDEAGQQADGAGPADAAPGPEAASASPKAGDAGADAKPVKRKRKAKK